MAYKFQLGASVLSGSLATVGDVSASLNISGAVSHVSASGELRGTGLQMKNVTGSAGFYATGSDGILWINARDGKVVVITPTNLAVNLAGDGLTATTGSVVVQVDDTGIEISEDSLQLKDDGVRTAKILSGSVTSVKIGDQQIIQRNLGTGSVEANAIKQAAVTMAAMATGSLENNAYATGSITQNHIKQGAITMAAMATGSLENNAYATGSITQNHIKQGAITMAAMGTGSLENNAYATGSVEASHLDGDAFAEGLAKLGANAVELDVDTLSQTITGSSLDGLDVLGIYDNANSIQKKSTVADLAVKLAGSNITATNGVLAAAAGGDSMTSTAIVDGDKLTAGINYFTGTINPAIEELIVSLPEASAPSVGDRIVVKGPSNCATDNRVLIQVSGTHLIDGLDQIVLNDAYAAVSLVYIVSGSWSII